MVIIQYLQCILENILMLQEAQNNGDSMEPEFHDGQIAWVLQQESVANGEIGIFALNGEAYIKKLQNDKDGIFLISLNEKYAPIKVMHAYAVPFHTVRPDW